jgi:endonuclease/exonuclease/phosphatase (EEP) superfamily protein YafD
MNFGDPSNSPTYTNSKLVAARVAHSAARKLFAANRSDASLELAERAAYAVVVQWREANEAARANAPTFHACPHTHCCGMAEHVRGTHYAHETQCPLHGNKTVGTCD